MPWGQELRNYFHAVTLAAATAATVLLASCMSADGPTRTVADVLRAHTAELMKIPGVVGTGEGEVHGEPAVIVMVSRRTPQVNSRVPHRLEGYPVEIKVVGDVRGVKESREEGGGGR